MSERRIGRCANLQYTTGPNSRVAEAKSNGVTLKRIPLGLMYECTNATLGQALGAMVHAMGEEAGTILREGVADGIGLGKIARGFIAVVCGAGVGYLA